MAPYTNIPLSPAELSYLHTSLSQTSPIRPDGRSPTQFRPLVAETDILPTANGSARVCFADGTEAVVGVKAEVEATKHRNPGSIDDDDDENDRERTTGQPEMDVDSDDEDEGVDAQAQGKGYNKNKVMGEAGWVEMSIEIPGMRDDDALPVFLAAMLTEALLADGMLPQRLYMNRRFHWRLYIDILLLSQPLSYPLPLLSLTTHLALLNTHLPSLISEKDEDPLFNDDWEASTPLYPKSSPIKPPITLLVMSVNSASSNNKINNDPSMNAEANISTNTNTNIFFDPSRDELAVADAVLAISCSPQTPPPVLPAGGGVSILQAGEDEGGKSQQPLKLVALRTVDPPSRLTAAGTPNVTGAGAGAGAALGAAEALALRERDQGVSVWRPPRGGVKRDVVARIIKAVLEKGGVGQEVMDGLAEVET